MAKLVTLAVILAVAVIGASASALPEPSENSEQKNIGIELVTEEKLQELLKQYPTAIELKPEVTQRKDVEGRSLVTYDYHFWYGQRNGLVDSWAAGDENEYTFLAYQPVEYFLNYPLQGIGKIITYIAIDIYSNDPSNVSVFMLEGGVGYRYCRFVMRSGPTRKFYYSASIYGQN